MNALSFILAALLPTASVDRLVSVVTTFVERLKVAEAKQLEIANKHEVAAGAARAEALKAGRIAANFDALTK